MLRPRSYGEIPVPGWKGYSPTRAWRAFPWKTWRTVHIRNKKLAKLVDSAERLTLFLGTTFLHINEAQEGYSNYDSWTVQCSKKIIKHKELQRSEMKNASKKYITLHHPPWNTFLTRAQCKTSHFLLYGWKFLVGYFEVTWHLTMKLSPAKISERATLQNTWPQRVTVHCYPRMLTHDRRCREV